MKQEELFDGKYKIHKVLGKGGGGTVFLAENIRMGTFWAIKEIDKKKVPSRQLISEPHVMKHLRHPSLPRVFDVIENDAFLYLIQDYIEGKTLESILQNQGAIPEEQLIQWAIAICDVLSYLHSLKPNPIIFRDIKPSNLIVEASGEIRLVDFGIAREYRQDFDGDTVCMGTVGYAAPEQFGTAQSDARTDIYSLGVTLYHCLTGISPDEGAFLTKQPGMLNGSWNPVFAEVIERAIKQDPELRFQSAEDMRFALEQSIGISHGSLRNRVSCGEQVPAVFGVGSVERNAGATYHAVMLAHHLARSRKKNVALVEYNNNPVFDFGKSKGQTASYRENGVVYFPMRMTSGDPVLNFNEFRAFSYVILDLGSLKTSVNGILTQNRYYHEMSRVNCPILVASGAPWKMGSIMAFNYVQDALQSWNVVVTPTAPSTFSRIIPKISNYFNHQRLYMSNYEPDPYQISADQIKLFERLLRELEPPMRKSIWNRFAGLAIRRKETHV